MRHAAIVFVSDHAILACAHVTGNFQRLAALEAVSSSRASSSEPYLHTTSTPDDPDLSDAAPIGIHAANIDLRRLDWRLFEKRLFEKYFANHATAMDDADRLSAQCIAGTLKALNVHESDIKSVTGKDGDKIVTFDKFRRLSYMCNCDECESCAPLPVPPAQQQT